MDTTAWIYTIPTTQNKPDTLLKVQGGRAADVTGLQCRVDQGPHSCASALHRRSAQNRAIGGSPSLATRSSDGEAQRAQRPRQTPSCHTTLRRPQRQNSPMPNRVHSAPRGRPPPRLRDEGGSPRRCVSPVQPECSRGLGLERALPLSSTESSEN